MMQGEAERERTALKEWAVLVDAMARGDIIAMVRKGGIREQRAGFTVRHDRFVFYPTYFHEKANELAPRFVDRLNASHESRAGEGLIRVQYFADVIGVWQVTELERLRDVSEEHGLAWSAVESRFRYKNKPGVQVVAVRVSRLAQAAMVPEIRRYAGCVSWVELDDAINVSTAEPVLDDTSVMMRVARLSNVLGQKQEGATNCRAPVTDSEKRLSPSSSWQCCRPWRYRPSWCCPSCEWSPSSCPCRSSWRAWGPEPSRA